MSSYAPDRWVVVKITNQGNTIYKVFGTWLGGYASGSEWRMNSGITQARFVDGVWEFDGSSGSVYYCRPNGYGTNAYTSSVLGGYVEKAKEVDASIDIMPEDTDWSGLAYDRLQQFVNKDTV